MARLVGFLVRNWPLKLAAVALATMLYTGLVLSQNARVWPGPVQIEPLRQPTGAFLLEPLPAVTDIRYLAPAEVAGRVTSADFRARVDLGQVTPQERGAPVNVRVDVIPLDDRMTVVDFQPRVVSVRLDPILTRVVPVSVAAGAIPEGVIVGEPQLSATTATVRGASSLVRSVRAAEARVTIDPNAINVDGNVALIAVDDRGEAVQPVDIVPEHVRVRVQVGRQLKTRSLPVVARFSGSLPPGYEARSVAVTPAIVTVGGDQSVLARLASVPTEPITLTGRTDDVRSDVGLALPGGATAVDRARVSVVVDVAPQRGSRSYAAGITLAGARPDHSYTVSAQSVLVTLGGELPTLDAVDPARLAAAVDVGRLPSGVHQVAVRVQPAAGTRLVSVSPARVAVTVSLTRLSGAGPPVQPPVAP